MPDFPSLAPGARTYTFGVLPVSDQQGVRFLHSTDRSACELQLGFVHLTEAEAALIRDHYRGQNGSHMSFLLSNAAWAGHSSMTDLLPAGTRWVYAAIPEETQRRGGLVDVSVSLRSVLDES